MQKFDPLIDASPDDDDFLKDVSAGLSRKQKTLPCKYLYDERGSHIFDRICDLEEYYPTRTEKKLMEKHIGEIANLCGRNVRLVEFGSGNSLKTRLLLEHLEEIESYVPIDISRVHLLHSTKLLAEEFPGLTIRPVCADFGKEWELPPRTPEIKRRVFYFPGSTIGNFSRAEAEEFLRRIAEHGTPDDGLLIGADLRKDPDVLRAAYDDSEGVTAEFNLNLLRRINEELGGDFDLGRFTHEAYWNEPEGRIEMRLVSQADQTVRIGDLEFSFDEGEFILTEYSHKYTAEGFRALARSAGYVGVKTWVDDDGLFSIHYLRIV